jgi:hypothetical protein
MEQFGTSEISNRFYLAGGTALALQLGHRLSFDLDYFSPSEDIPSIRQLLANALLPFSPILADSSWGNLVFLASGVRVGFYGYGYPLVGPLVDADGIRLAGVADIGLMKLDALLGRAGRKDFFDLYVICQSVTLSSLLELAPLKYPSIRDFETQVVKRLAFFDIADQEAQPTLLQEVAWDTVKTFFRKQAVEIGRRWIK